MYSSTTSIRPCFSISFAGDLCLLHIKDHQFNSIKAHFPKLNMPPTPFFSSVVSSCRIHSFNLRWTGLRNPVNIAHWIKFILHNIYYTYAFKNTYTYIYLKKSYLYTYIWSYVYPHIILCVYADVPPHLFPLAVGFPMFSRSPGDASDEFQLFIAEDEITSATSGDEDRGAQRPGTRRMEKIGYPRQRLVF